MKERFYFRNVARRWKKEVQAAESGLIALFPYITSTAAETVLLVSAVPSECEVYTDFSPLPFINGSSCLKTLKGLLEEGVKLFHLPDLHAKVLFSRDRFVSIGSQNLTTRGTRRLEASACFDDHEDLRHVEAQLKAWLTRRIPITLEMIEDMMQLIPQANSAYKELSSVLTEISVEVEERRKTREEEARCALQAAQDRERIMVAHEQRLRELQFARDRVHKSRLSVLCTVRRIERYDGWTDTNGTDILRKCF